MSEREPHPLAGRCCHASCSEPSVYTLTIEVDAGEPERAIELRVLVCDDHLDVGLAMMAEQARELRGKTAEDLDLLPPIDEESQATLDAINSNDWGLGPV